MSDMAPTEPLVPGHAAPASVRVPAARRLLRRIDPLHGVGIVLLLGVWQALTWVLPEAVLPSPLGVAARIGADFFSAPELEYFGLSNASLLGSMLYTGENVVIAVLLGGAIGVPLGLLTARIGVLRAVVDPVMRTAGTVPILVVAPFLLIWFGVSRASSVLLVVAYVTVILYVFAQRAADNLNPIYEDSARTLGAGPRRIILDLLIPGVLPEILGGWRIALAGAWGLEAIAELLGAQQGMGKIIEVLAGATDAQGIMAALVVLGLVAILFDWLSALAIGRIAAWHQPAHPGGR